MESTHPCEGAKVHPGQNIKSTNDFAVFNTGLYSHGPLKASWLCGGHLLQPLKFSRHETLATWRLIRAERRDTYSYKSGSWCRAIWTTFDTYNYTQHIKQTKKLFMFHFIFMDYLSSFHENGVPKFQIPLQKRPGHLTSSPKTFSLVLIQWWVLSHL